VEEPLIKLNQSAKAMAAADEEAARSLTNEVFESLPLPDVPVFTQELIKERVARTELKYRQGAHEGIPESKVAKTVNEIAVRLEAPGYEKVSPAMVRTVRVSLMLQLPNFIAQDGPGKKKERQKSRKSINPGMSPLEATAVMLFLVQQKMLNEAYQVSHHDFFATIHQKQLQRWHELRDLKDRSGKLVRDSHANRKDELRVISKSKANEVRQAAKAAVEKMSPDDLLNLADSFLDTLGMNR
jgi:hypothetical protein